ncbi:MAG: oligoribonuclease [Glaciecola sp.]|nr:oligoribonuclease [Glaciecola sp.]
MSQATLSPQYNDSNLIWIDMEMTGLDPDTCVVLEIATIVTDAQLNVLVEGPVLAIHQSDEVLANMNEWCIDVHGKTGLTQRCRDSKISAIDAQAQTIAFLSQWVPAGKSPLCGNTIGQDRRFMVKYMPELEAYCHYRSIDVSTIKELAARWQPDVLKGFNKKGVHLALADIQESIAELQYYRTHVFKI